MWTPDRLPCAFGRYRLLRQLGKGGMAFVYEADDTELGRRVALKLPDLRNDPENKLRRRFRREARIAARLSHPNLCPIYDFGDVKGGPYGEAGVPFLTMPLLEGLSLDKPEARTRLHPFPTVVVAAVHKVARAMQHMHERNFIHRDLKPGNLFILADGTPILIDFGLARPLVDQDAPLTVSGDFVGTLAYAAPEQLNGDVGEDPGPRCDVYGLGVVLYDLLAGRPPFLGDVKYLIKAILEEPPVQPSHWVSAIDSSLDAICLKAIRKNPDERYATMADFATALEGYLRAAPPSATAVHADESERLQRELDRARSEHQSAAQRLRQVQQQVAEAEQELFDERQARADDRAWGEQLATRVAEAEGLAAQLLQRAELAEQRQAELERERQELRERRDETDVSLKEARENLGAARAALVAAQHIQDRLSQELDLASLGRVEAARDAEAARTQLRQEEGRHAQTRNQLAETREHAEETAADLAARQAERDLLADAVREARRVLREAAGQLEAPQERTPEPEPEPEAPTDVETSLDKVIKYGIF